MPFQPQEAISEIVASRLKAVKRLQDNPNDPEALLQLSEAEERVGCLSAGIY